MSSRLYIVGAVLLLATAAGAPPLGRAAGPRQGAAGTGKSAPAAVQPAESPLQPQARQLISSAADEAPKWDDARAAVRVLSKAADILWDEDPARARAWLTSAWEVSGKVKAKSDEQSAVRMRGSERARARSEVLSVAQKHDAKFAKQLVDTLAGEKDEPESREQRGPFGDRTARSEQLLNLALANVETNPALAESLAERSLADGISYQLQEVLLKLRARDPNLANRLFDAALPVLATAFSQPSEGQVLASYLFTPGRVLGVDAQSKVKVTVNPLVPKSSATPAQADPVRARRFLTVMQQRLLAMPAPSTTANPVAYAQDFLTLLKSLAVAYGKYAPDLWLPLEQRMVQFAPDAATAARRSPSSGSEGSRASSLTSGLGEGELHRRQLDDLEAAADDETDPVARKHAYLRAALHTNVEELERGLKIASKIEERELREQVVSFLNYRAALEALEKKRVEEAVALTSDIMPTQKAIVLISAAQALAKERPKGEAEWQAGSRMLRSLELLTEADKLIQREDDQSIDVLRVRMGLVTALAQSDPIRAYSRMGDVVKALNGMKSFDFMNTSAPRIAGLGEPTAELLLPHIGSGYGIMDAFVALSRADFQGSVQTANQIASPSGRGLVLLEIGGGVLQAKHPQRAAPKVAASPQPQQ